MCSFEWGALRRFSAGVLMFVKTQAYVTQIRSLPTQLTTFLCHFRSTMSSALRRRKIAVLGSRSVGEFSFLNDETLKTSLESSRQVIAC